MWIMAANGIQSKAVCKESHGSSNEVDQSNHTYLIHEDSIMINAIVHSMAFLTFDPKYFIGVQNYI